jgi:hypothetical protein
MFIIYNKLPGFQDGWQALVISQQPIIVVYILEGLLSIGELYRKTLE